MSVQLLEVRHPCVERTELCGRGCDHLAMPQREVTALDTQYVRGQQQPVDGGRRER
ncbi:hypothetical protein AB0F18_13065 [Streptomyces sp. NPDC029216]|uniref:hypothetical protein n=1 Tax=Streptomyces sp. NPDC029216 TaxID=3154701 RepID=UPI0034038B10